MNKVNMKDKVANRGVASFEVFTKGDFRFLLLKYPFAKELETFFKKIPEDAELRVDMFSWVDYENIHENNSPAIFTSNPYMAGFYLLYLNCFLEAMEHFKSLEG